MLTEKDLNQMKTEAKDKSFYKTPIESSLSNFPQVAQVSLNCEMQTNNLRFYSFYFNCTGN